MRKLLIIPLSVWICSSVFCLPDDQFICLLVCLSVYLSISLTNCLSLLVCWSFCRSLFLSVCLQVGLFLCLFLFCLSTRLTSWSSPVCRLICLSVFFMPVSLSDRLIISRSVFCLAVNWFVFIYSPFVPF